MQSICKHIISALVLFGVFGTANADCWEEAGREFSIAPELLYAIAEQESNLNPRAIGHNSNGSRDIGLMQVNTYHLPRLAKYGITEQSLLNDSCRALKVGAGKSFEYGSESYVKSSASHWDFSSQIQGI